MGVPKFYRWISERYPCLSEVLREYQIPEFDNLYLDMNGIVHVCSHPDDANPHFRITEEKIFKDILHYIEVLFRMIKPKKTFFMAIDGVAPRAKMNQQRSRRFRSAADAEEQARIAVDKGEILPTDDRFDSNCITPGTAFMVRLQEQLKYMVVQKMSSDPLWKGVQVYLSGHETPGEGEHKIMDFIRAQKCKPGYDPNLRHCLYGLDADLMMLGLVTHEPHMSLLREEVRFGGKKDRQKRSNAAEDTTFHLLHLSLMREYIDFEFKELKETLQFEYDLECIINDWVFLGFLIGNDFIPHLPHIHIQHQCLPLLWQTYINVLPTLDGYLNDYGELNLERFQSYMEELKKHDIETFSERHADLRWLEGKQQKEPKKSEKLKKLEAASATGIITANKYATLMEEEKQTVTSNDVEVVDIESETDNIDDIEDDPEEIFDIEFRNHKNAYYVNKLKATKVTKEYLREQCEGYIRGLQWILSYYFHGCPSWGWFYPHHYAPYISDVQNFKDYKIVFDYGKPFLPFEQLMAVLPAGSKKLMPKPLRTLMTDTNSPIIDFYPEKFECDLNGKQQAWEAVVLICFINEGRLINAMQPIIEQLNPEDAARNTHGPHVLFEWSEESQGVYPTSFPSVFPDIVNYHAKITKVPMFEFVIPPEKLYRGLCEGVRLDVHFPGYPTLKHIKHTSKLQSAGVKVFQMNSRGDNMVLSVTAPDVVPDTEQVAHSLLGTSTYVGWPHLCEAQVVSVSDQYMEYSIEWRNKKKIPSNPPINQKHFEESEASLWRKEVLAIRERCMERRGINIGSTTILLHCRPMSGRRYVSGRNGKITLNKQWHDSTQAYVYQTSVKDISVRDPTFTQYCTLDELFAVDTDVFMLASPHYGACGKVLNIDPKNEGRIRVCFKIPVEPQFDKIIQQQWKHSTNYHEGYMLAKKIGVSSYMVSRFTGTIFICKGARGESEKPKNINIGLNVRFTKTGQEVPGFSKKHGDKWLFSDRTKRILEDYISRFPFIFEYVSDNTNEPYYEEDIFYNPDECCLDDLVEYLKSVPSANVDKVDHGTEVLDEPIVKLLMENVASTKVLNESRKKSTKNIQVKPYLLYRPLDAQDSHFPDVSATYELFDRVVNVHQCFTVPLGLRGTVVGIHPADKPHEVLYEVVFDAQFLGGLTLLGVKDSCYRMPPYTLINLSYGIRMETSGKKKPTAVIKPHLKPQAGYDSQNKNQPQAWSANQNRTGGGYQSRGGGATNQHPATMNPQSDTFSNVWQQLQKNTRNNKPSPQSSHDNWENYKHDQRNESIQQQRSNQTPPRYKQNRNQQYQSGSGRKDYQQQPSRTYYGSASLQRQQHSTTQSHEDDSVSLDMAAKTLPQQVRPSGPSIPAGAHNGSKSINPEMLFQMTGNTKVQYDGQSIGKELSAPSQQPMASPKSSGQINSQQLQADGEEFANIMKSLQLAQPNISGQIAIDTTASTALQPMDVQQGTEALCEMLKIPKDSQKETKQNSKPVYSLSKFCNESHMNQPKYDYIYKGTQIQCIISLDNGSRYPGSLHRTKTLAAESAASTALNELQPEHNSNQRKQQRQPLFNTSPNSAFKPIKQLMDPQMAMSYPQGYQGWNPQTQPQIYGHGQAGQQFNHPPPQQYGGGYNQREQQPQLHYQKQHQQPYQHMHSGHQGMKDGGRGGHPGTRQQYQPTQSANNWVHPTWIQPQAQGAHQHHGGQRQGSGKHQKQGQPEKEQGTPQKSNPFIPLQAMKKQTPQKQKGTDQATKTTEAAEQSVESQSVESVPVVKTSRKPRNQTQPDDSKRTTPQKKGKNPPKKSPRIAANFSAAS